MSIILLIITIVFLSEKLLSTKCFEILFPDIKFEMESWGQFGDYVGGILNPIFGLISVVILSVTLNSQRESTSKTEFNNHFFLLLEGFFLEILLLLLQGLRLILEYL